MTEPPAADTPTAPPENPTVDRIASAMAQIFPAMAVLNKEEQTRVIQALSALYLDRSLATPQIAGLPPSNPPEPVQIAPAHDYRDFAEFFDRAGTPKFAADKALVAGYWLQEHLGKESFKSQEAGEELRAAGYPVANMTDAMGKLARRKPSLVLQTGRVGPGKRAHKLHKLSAAGVTAVRKMLGEQ